MRKPLIGLSCGTHHEREGTAYYGVLPAYCRAVEAAGGLPVLIVPDLDSDSLRTLFDRLEGVLLTGGGDVDPAVYGLPPHTDLRSVSADRDSTEINLSRWAAEDDKPLLGICRGIQVMNVAFGGTLYQDIGSDYAKRIDHDLGSSQSRDFEGHTVEVRSGSKLAELLGETSVPVNSMHHQAIRDVGRTLLPVATAPDGLIEGVEREGLRFFVGVQWHPEEIYPYSEPMRRLFESFVKQAAGSS